jgi:prepilin-type processing-associated H-X9-DG protein
MRRFPFGCRIAHVLAIGVGGLALILAPTAPAPAQSPANEGARPIVAAPLARYVPRQDLLAYVEFEGVDNRAEGWRKTAAYALLNQTSLGVMLESLATQLAETALAAAPGARVTGGDVVAMAKHAARSGFVFAACGKPGPEPPVVVWVLRGAAREDARGLFNRLVGQLNRSGDKPQSVVRAGGREVFEIKSEQGAGWSWWAEKDDLVIAMASPTSVDAIIETLDGERPNAIEHPIRAELARPEGDFTPLFLAFVDLSTLPDLPPQAVSLGLDGLKRIDYRWGFHREALMSVVGIKAPRPRHGFLALLDQPTFGAPTLPPIPRDQANFTIVSLDLKSTYDQATSLMRETVGTDAPLEALAQAVYGSTGQRLRDDLLAHLGPRLAFYIVPTKVNAPTNSITGMMMPMLEVPKAVLLAEVDDAAAFGKTLDALAAHVNKSASERAARADVGPGDADDAQGPRRARRDPPRPGTTAIELRPLPGPEKGYVLSIPPGVVPLPAGLRPTVLVGKTHVVLATSPEAARHALDQGARPVGSPAPPGTAAAKLEHLPANLILLSVNNPRDSLYPELLSNLPSLIQMFAMVAANDRPGGRRPGLGRLLPAEGFRIQIDPATIPPADDLRRHLFPGSFGVSVDDQGIRITSREAFPSVNPLFSSPVIAPAALVALLMPATTSAREAARRAQCTNNLKQMALAFHNFHSAENHFPPAAITDKDGKPLLSWRVAILPYLEQQDLYSKFHLDEPWDSPHNKALIPLMPATYACPSGMANQPHTTFYRVYTGKQTVFEGNEGQGIAGITDGTSNTLLVVEATAAVPWTKPDELRLDPDPEKPLPKFEGKNHPGGFNAAFGDGSVRFIKNSIDPVVLRALITRNGGEVINADDF